jgi:hypothetical protein
VKAKLATQGSPSSALRSTGALVASGLDAAGNPLADNLIVAARAAGRSTLKASINRFA